MLPNGRDCATENGPSWPRLSCRVDLCGSFCSERRWFWIISDHQVPADLRLMTKPDLDPIRVPFRLLQAIQTLACGSSVRRTVHPYIC